MTEEDKLVKLCKEIENALIEINNVTKANISLLRDLNQLTAEDGQMNSDLKKAADQFNYLMSKLNVKSQQENVEHKEGAGTETEDDEELEVVDLS